jgi:hypothetical protein
LETESGSCGKIIVAILFMRKKAEVVKNFCLCGLT